MSIDKAARRASKRMIERDMPRTIGDFLRFIADNDVPLSTRMMFVDSDAPAVKDVREFQFTGQESDSEFKPTLFLKGEEFI